jgi:hypothetical protein
MNYQEYLEKEKQFRYQNELRIKLQAEAEYNPTAKSLRDVVTLEEQQRLLFRDIEYFLQVYDEISNTESDEYFYEGSRYPV